MSEPSIESWDVDPISSGLSGPETSGRWLDPADDAWDKPKPLTSSANLPRFPIETAFPPKLGWLRCYIQQVANCYQVPPELPALLTVVVASLCASKVTEVEPQPGWREPLPLWALVLMESGERKSAVFAKVMEPLYKWMRERRIDLSPKIVEHNNRVDLVRQRLKKAVKKAAQAAASEIAEREAKELALELDGLERTAPYPPSFVTTDTTTEALARVLFENNERALVASPEGDAIDVVLGRYSDSPNLGIWLSGHAGDSVETRRRSREPDRLHRPALAVALVVQPEAARSLLVNPDARGRGLLARFMMCTPPSLVGHRELEPPPVSEEDSFWWDTAVCNLLAKSVPTAPDILRLNPAAKELLLRFREQVEVDLRLDERLGAHRDWGSKLPGLIVRLAGVLHALQASDAEIDAATMGAALTWADFLVAHEAHVSRLTGQDPAVNIAERIVSWIRKTEPAEFSRRDAFNGVRGGPVRRVADIDQALELLVDYAWIRDQPVPPQAGAGRKPSPRFAVHPDARRKRSSQPQNTQNAQNRAAEVDSADSAYSAAEKDVDEQAFADEGERF